MKKCICLIFIFIFAGNGIAADVDTETYHIDMEKLKAGKLQVFTEEFILPDGNKKKRVIGVLLINRPPSEVWNVLKDWDKMGEYVPGLKYYKTIYEIKPVADDSPGETLIEGQLKVPLLTVVYTVRVKFDPLSKYRIEWALLRDDEITDFGKKNVSVKKHTAGLKNIGGFGYLESFENGTKTIYTYAPVVEISLPVPGFVERYISKSSLSGYLKAVKERVEGNK